MKKELNLEKIKQGLGYYKKSSEKGTEFEDVCIIALNLVNELERVKTLTLGGVNYWVAVKDELPTEGKRVKLEMTSGKISICYVLNGFWYNDGRACKVTDLGYEPRQWAEIIKPPCS